MKRDRDIRELDRAVKQLDANIKDNAKEIERYKSSIRELISMSESFDADARKARSRTKDKQIELEHLIEADKEDREKLEELTTALEYLKNGPPEVKAFMNPRPASEKKITAYGV
jgi:predicted RNase H-like nuclease (RuvC/YqgF family)